MVQEVALRPNAGRGKNSANYDAEAELSKTLTDFLRGYTPESGQNTEKDILGKRYQIDTNSPLPDFNSKNAAAYKASDLKSPNTQYIALICENKTLQRTQIITPLINAPHPNLAVIAASGIVHISKFSEERFVIISEKPKGEKLSKLIASAKNRPSFEFICQYIISPAALAINHLSELGIAHGNINCDNIYFDTSSTVGAVIGQCITEPCGFAQPFYYEPIERAQALPEGKGEGDNTQDYYALAVVVLHIIYGMEHFSSFTENNLIKTILREGAFNALTRNKDMPAVFYDFFRGMLSYSAHDRWNYRYLKAWLDGKRYNVMPTPPQQEALRPFEFKEDSAYTRREVANLFFKHWQSVPEMFLEGHISTWVAVSLRNKELNEYIARAAKILSIPGKQNDPYLKEQIMRTIAVFDPMGPIRLEKLAFHLDGIGSLFAQAMLNGNIAEQQLLMQFIELSMFHFVTDQKNKELSGGYLDSEYRPTDTTITRLDRMRSIIRNNGFGFGAERIFYDLNKETRCISPMLNGIYVSSLPALLKFLDSSAARLSTDKDPIDRHIAAFIGSKLEILHEVHLVSLSVHPTLAKSNAMLALKLLAAAQRKTGLNYLPGLSNSLALRILPLLDVIRSKTLKRKLISMLANTARSGNLTKMADIFIDSGYAQAEVTAFGQAIRSFKQNAIDIVYYGTGEMLDANSKILGTKAAHRVAFVALIAGFIYSIRNA